MGGPSGFTPDGAQLVTGSRHRVRSWKLRTGDLTRELRVGGLIDLRSRVALSPDGTRLATVNNWRTVQVLDATTGQQQLRVTHCGIASVDGEVFAVAFSPDGTRLATAGSNKTVRVWDATSGRLQLQVTHGQRVFAVAFSPDGARLVTAGGDRTARIWDATSRTFR